MYGASERESCAPRPATADAHAAQSLRYTQATTAGSPRSLTRSIARLLARGDAQLIVALGIDHFMLITVSHVLQIKALASRQLEKI